MPKSKKQFIRFNVIDSCLRNTARHYGYEELLEAIHSDLTYRDQETIGKTTFYQDIIDTRLEFGVPIETRKDGNRTFYKC